MAPWKPITDPLQTLLSNLATPHGGATRAQLNAIGDAFRAERERQAAVGAGPITQARYGESLTRLVTNAATRGPLTDAQRNAITNAWRSEQAWQGREIQAAEEGRRPAAANTQAHDGLETSVRDEATTAPRQAINSSDDATADPPTTTTSTNSVENQPPSPSAAPRRSARLKSKDASAEGETATDSTEGRKSARLKSRQSDAGELHKIAMLNSALAAGRDDARARDLEQMRAWGTTTDTGDTIVVSPRPANSTSRTENDLPRQRETSTPRGTNNSDDAMAGPSQPASTATDAENDPAPQRDENAPSGTINGDDAMADLSQLPNHANGAENDPAATTSQEGGLGAAERAVHRGEYFRREIPITEMSPRTQELYREARELIAQMERNRATRPTTQDLEDTQRHVRALERIATTTSTHTRNRTAPPPPANARKEVIELYNAEQALAAEFADLVALLAKKFMHVLFRLGLQVEQKGPRDGGRNERVMANLEAEQRAITKQLIGIKRKERDERQERVEKLEAEKAARDAHEEHTEDAPEGAPEDAPEDPPEQSDSEYESEPPRKRRRHSV